MKKYKFSEVRRQFGTGRVDDSPYIKDGIIYYPIEKRHPTSSDFDQPINEGHFLPIDKEMMKIIMKEFKDKHNSFDEMVEDFKKGYKFYLSFINRDPELFIISNNKIGATQMNTCYIANVPPRSLKYIKLIGSDEEYRNPFNEEVRRRFGTGEVGELPIPISRKAISSRADRISVVDAIRRKFYTVLTKEQSKELLNHVSYYSSPGIRNSLIIMIRNGNPAGTASHWYVGIGIVNRNGKVLSTESLSHPNSDKEFFRSYGELKNAWKGIFSFPDIKINEEVRRRFGMREVEPKRLKIGDKVKIVKKVTNDGFGWFNWVSPDMDETVGSIGEIKKISKMGDYRWGSAEFNDELFYHVDLEDPYRRWWYHRDALKKVYREEVRRKFGTGSVTVDNIYYPTNKIVDARNESNESAIENKKYISLRKDTLDKLLDILESDGHREIEQTRHIINEQRQKRARIIGFAVKEKTIDIDHKPEYLEEEVFDADGNYTYYYPIFYIIKRWAGRNTLITTAGDSGHLWADERDGRYLPKTSDFIRRVKGNINEEVRRRFGTGKVPVSDYKSIKDIKKGDIVKIVKFSRGNEHTTLFDDADTNMRGTLGEIGKVLEVTFYDESVRVETSRNTLWYDWKSLKHLKRINEEVRRHFGTGHAEPNKFKIGDRVKIIKDDKSYPHEIEHGDWYPGREEKLKKDKVYTINYINIKKDYKGKEYERIFLYEDDYWWLGSSLKKVYNEEVRRQFGTGKVETDYFVFPATELNKLSSAVEVDPDKILKILEKDGYNDLEGLEREFKYIIESSSDGKLYMRLIGINSVHGLDTARYIYPTFFGKGGKFANTGWWLVLGEKSKEQAELDESVSVLYTLSRMIKFKKGMNEEVRRQFGTGSVEPDVILYPKSKIGDDGVVNDILRKGLYVPVSKKILKKIQVWEKKTGANTYAHLFLEELKKGNTVVVYYYKRKSVVYMSFSKKNPERVILWKNARDVEEKGFPIKVVEG